MTREEFQRRYSGDWDRLERLLAHVAERRQTLAPYASTEPPDLAEFDRLYRAVCKHLALARMRLYGTDLEYRLNDLALRAHHRFYGGGRGYLRRSLTFLAGGFAATVRRQSRLVLAATLLFVLPALGMAVARWADPEAAYTVLGTETVRGMEEMYDPGSDYRSRERRADSDLMMFGFYIANNIGIAFRVFAGGVLFGAGSVLLLVFNGLHIGAVASHLTAEGYSATFWSFVAGHSALELTAIVLSGAAGLRLAGALFSPGRRTRLAALRHSAHDSVGMITGVFFMLLGAAFIEAFWSAGSAPDEIKYGVGILIWVALLAYFGLAGRNWRRRGA